MQVASSSSVGLPRTSPATTTIVSAARIHSSRRDFRTACAFSRAMRFAKSVAASPVIRISSIFAGCTANSIPAFRKSSRRRGEAEASTIRIGSGLQRDVIDQAGLAQECGNRDQYRFGNFGFGFKRVRIDDFQIVKPNFRVLGELLLA